MLKYTLKRKFTSLQFPAFDYTPQKYSGPSREEMLKIRQKHMNPAVFLYYKNPLEIVEGKMQYVWDAKGQRYIDALAGILTISIGHSHPKFVEAGVKQMEKLVHMSSVYLNDQQVLYAKELADRLPPELNNIYVTNSGGEANDMAVFMARCYSKNHNILCLRNSYHGIVGATYSLTNLSSWKKNIFPLPGFEKVLNPDLYRGPYQGQKAVDYYANDVESVIKYCTSGDVAGYIAEPIQGAGGIVPMPLGYLKKVYQTVRQHGGVCISDEVQTGFGRTGSHYWGFQRNEVSPDIVTMAKSVGNGASLGIVATKKEIAESIGGKLLFNTFGGNPLVCALGRTVLKVIDEENMIANIKAMGDILENGLKNLQQKYEIVGDIRGAGLMQGIEFVIDKKSKTPNPKASNNVLERLKEMKVLLGKGGLYGNVLRVAPPYCINKEDCEYILGALELCLEEIQQGKLNYF